MIRTIPIHVKRLPHAATLPLPSYATVGASGVDLLAAVERDIVLYSYDRRVIPTGIAVAVPSGYELQIRPRSGLAAKHGVTVINTPGTIDADYRGEIHVVLVNHGDTHFIITRGMRIAQAVLCPIVQIDWQPVVELPDTSRGGGGFGSTGV
jgi:dUTP pyrophosphatase